MNAGYAHHQQLQYFIYIIVMGLRNMSAMSNALSYKTSHKVFLQAFERVISPPPCWLMRQAGRYLPEYRTLRRGQPNFVSFCFTPSLAVEAALQPLRRYPLDAAILFSDILTLLKPLGVDLTFVESEGPVLSYGSWDKLLSASNVTVLREMQPIFETVRQLKHEIPKQTALIGFAGAPWTLLCYLLNGGASKSFDRAKQLIARHPEVALALCRKITDITTVYLEEQIIAGAEAIQIFDSWAGLLPYSWVDDYLFNPWRTIVESLKKSYPGVPILGFIKGAGALLPTFVNCVSVDGVSLDSSVPLETALSLPQKCVIQGGMESSYVVSGGDAMIREARRYLDAFKGRSYIFNLGHGVPQYTPPENISHLLDFVKSYS